MQQHIQTLVKQFFHKNTLQEVTEQELEQFASEFPYSAVGQYLFAKKLALNGEENGGASSRQEQKEKTTLYFHNPMWCRWLMEEHEQPGKLPATEHYPVKEEIVTVSAPPPPPIPTVPEPEPQSFSEPEPLPQPIPEPTPVTMAEIVAPVENAKEIPAPAPAPEPENKIEGGTPVITDTGDDVPFEPYHTIDYFASLGIKLKPEDFTKDKLGQQLKSFTEWLRSMKRVQGTGASTVTLDDITNQSIQQIAELSVSEKEVVTETMAEVWAKQGNKDKAIEIYEKLSLLNPAKNAYFAAKIDQLKAS